MDTLPLLVVVYLVGMLCAIVIHSAGRAFRGGTIPSPLSAMARASVWPLGLLMALAGIVAGMPIILGTRIGQGMRQGLQAHAAAPAPSMKVPVQNFRPSKSPSAKSPEWPTGNAAPTAPSPIPSPIPTPSETSPSSTNANPPSPASMSATN